MQFMFQFFAQDPSLTRLRAELHRRGWYSRSGKPWGKMTIDYILRNPTYQGKVHFNDQVFQGEHEAIVEEGLFHKVQSMTREHSRAETKIQRIFLLKGLLKCSVCDSVMTPHYTQKRRKDQSIHRIAYYRCTKTMHQNNAVCTVKALNADTVERQVIEYLSTLSQQADWVKGTVEELNRDQKERVRPLEQEAIRLRASLDRLGKRNR